MSDTSSKWIVVIDGEVQDRTFDDEESANMFAGKQRESHSQKIVVFQPNTARHKKAFDGGWTKLPTKSEPKK